MAIRFSCQCGKQLQAKDEFAGRRMKCPDCGNVLEIPAQVAADAPLPVLPEEKISVVEEVVPVVPASPPPVVPVVPVVAAVRPAKLKTKTATNIWATNSLDQQITPWSPHNNQRTGRISEGERRGGKLPLLLLILVLLIAAGSALWYYGPALQKVYQVAAEREERIQNQGPFAKLSDLDLVPRNGILFVSFRVADWWNGPALAAVNNTFFPGIKIDDKTIKQEWGLSPGEIERVTIFAPQNTAINLAQPGGLCALIRTNQPYDSAALQQALFGDEIGEVSPVIGRLTRRPHLAVAIFNDRTLLIGREDVVQRFANNAPTTQDEGPLSHAIELAGSGQPFVAGINVSPASRKSLLSDAPEEWAKLLSVLFESDATTLSINRVKGLGMALHLSYAEEAKAKNAKKAAEDIGELLKKLIPQARENMKKLRYARQEAPIYHGSAAITVGNAAAALFSPLGPLQALAAPSDAGAIAKHVTKGKRDPFIEIKMAEIQQIESISKTIKVESENNNIHVSLFVEEKDPHPFIGIADFLSGIRKTARFQSRQNMTRIAAALHQYHAVNGHFPPDGKELSWRVELLPYLGQTNLYKSFDLKKSWEDKENAQHLNRMPKVFAPPATLGKSQGRTYYQIFTGPGTIFDAGKKIGLANIKDGLSNTVLVVESLKRVQWTKPGGITVDGKEPAAERLHGLFTGRIWAVFADGSVRRLPADLTDEQLRALVTISGGKKK